MKHALALNGVGPAPLYRRYEPSDRPALLRMYVTFDPKGAYHGLPPHKRVVTEQWLSGLLGNPRNNHFLLAADGNIMGHAALVHYPNTPDSQEIIIFVHQEFQHRGWGRKLFLAAMNHACLRLKLNEVWLMVEWHNIPALRLYRSIGFKALPSTNRLEEMVMRRPLGCGNCAKDECAIFSSELAQAA